jgi:pimeloyl-ACP methyl ester carboxylesterase
LRRITGRRAGRQGRRHGAQQQFESVHQLFAGLSGFDNAVLAAVDARLQALTVPTLIARGTDDVFFPMACARQLAETIPGTTELVKIEGGRLLFPLERPDELVAPLVRHWDATDPVQVGQR